MVWDTTADHYQLGKKLLFVVPSGHSSIFHGPVSRGRPCTLTRNDRFLDGASTFKGGPNNKFHHIYCIQTKMTKSYFSQCLWIKVYDHLFKLFKIENQKRTPNLQNKMIHIQNFKLHMVKNIQFQMFKIIKPPVSFKPSPSQKNNFSSNLRFYENSSKYRKNIDQLPTYVQHLMMNSIMIKQI